MLFNSWVFPIFLIIVLIAYYLSRHRMQNALLLISSYVFYGWWDWRFLSLLLISTVVDFTCGQLIAGSEDSKKRFRYLLLSLCVNLGILGFFKYFNFFVGSFQGLTQTLGLEVQTPVLQVILPVGISFYTFQTMAYTIDIYRRKETPTNNFLDFALYVAYFPQLVAGPIERSTNLLPQFATPRTTTRSQVTSGFQLILMGFFKKLLIADSVSPIVTQIFDDPASQGTGVLLIGVYLFALQIYGDFAGYTDIARGVSRLLGIELCINFSQPYISSNITEFWRRWHQSLSSWLRDYLYIPLGGNRKGKIRTYINNMLTMLLGGLWHGASWNFVIWGGLHGIYLAVHKYMSGGKKVGVTPFPTTSSQFGGWIIKSFVTFNLVCLAWIFFRAQGFDTAWTYVSNLATQWTVIGDSSLLIQGLVALTFFGGLAATVDLLCWKNQSETPFQASWSPLFRGLAYAAMILLIILIGENNEQPFIYFQF